jgi:hypothetical protein
LRRDDVGKNLAKIGYQQCGNAYDRFGFGAAKNCRMMEGGGFGLKWNSYRVRRPGKGRYITV